MDSRISSVKHLYKTQNIVVLKNTDISDSWRIWLDYQGLVSLNSKVLSLCHAGASGSQVGTGERASKDLYPRIFRTLFPKLSCGPAQKEVERWMTSKSCFSPPGFPTPVCACVFWCIQMYFLISEKKESDLWTFCMLICRSPWT